MYRLFGIIYSVLSSVLKLLLILAVCIIIFGIIVENNKSKELEIELERSSQKFKAENVNSNDHTLAKSFSDISALDKGVKTIWEQHQSTDLNVNLALEMKEKINVEYEKSLLANEMKLNGLEKARVSAEQVLKNVNREIELLATQMKSDKDEFEEKLSNIERSIVEAKRVSDWNMALVKYANSILERTAIHKFEAE